jgi:spore photoproduct lyase
MGFQTALDLSDKYKPRTFGTKKHPNIIRYFDKTPRDICCPHFYELNWAYGCRFNCAYCYLQGTFRGNIEPRYIPLREVFYTLDSVFKHPLMIKPSVFNSGELTDSLGFPSIMEKISDKFEEQNKHKLLILTKSSNVQFLIDKFRKNTIVSFSVNAPAVAKKWENGAAPPLKRISAIEKLCEKGYDVRARIDPIFPIENWKKEYGDFIYKLVSNSKITRITLGTPRGLAKTRLYSKDSSWWKFAFENNPTEDTGWGKKLAPYLRKEIYLYMVDKLRESGYKGHIAMCKETVVMWGELGMKVGKYPNWKYCKCNCVG